MLMQRINLVSHHVEAGADVRRLCNVVKRLTCVACLSVQRGIPAQDVVEAINEITVSALVRIGFDVDDEPRLQKVLPIFLEASGSLLEMGLNGAGEGAKSKIDSAIVQVAIQSLASVAKSRAIVRAIERPYGFTGEDAIDLRIAASAASANIASAFARLSLPYPLPKLVSLGTGFVVEQAMSAAEAETPIHANSSARRMLAQSFLTNAAKMYATCLESLRNERHTSGHDISHFLAPVHAQFKDAFLATRASSMAHLIEFDVVDFKRVYGSISEQLNCEIRPILADAESVPSPMTDADRGQVTPSMTPGMSAIAQARSRYRHA